MPFENRLLQRRRRKLEWWHVNCATYIELVEIRQTESKDRDLFVIRTVNSEDLVLHENKLSCAHVGEDADEKMWRWQTWLESSMITKTDHLTMFLFIYRSYPFHLSWQARTLTHLLSQPIRNRHYYPQKRSCTSDKSDTREWSYFSSWQD